MAEPNWTHYRGRLAGLRRTRPADDPQVIEAASELAAARAEHTVQRAIDDPAQLARAARIVRTALARKRLTLADVAPIPQDVRAAG